MVFLPLVALPFGAAFGFATGLAGDLAAATVFLPF
jgi:hypothetical protein